MAPPREDIPVAARPAAAQGGAAQTVSLLPSIHLAFSIARGAEFSKIDPLARSICLARVIFTPHIGGAVGEAVEQDLQSFGETISYAVRDPKVTAVALSASVVGRHPAGRFGEAPLMAVAYQVFTVTDGKIAQGDERSPLCEVTSRGNDVDVVVQVDVLDFTEYWFALKKDNTGETFLADRARAREGWRRRVSLPMPPAPS